MDKDRLVFEDFKDLVGSIFTIKGDGFPPFVLTLEEAKPLRERMPRSEARPPFSLIFVSADPRVLPQRLYSVEHGEMGDVVLFLVPVGKTPNGVNYQALFN